MRKFSIAALVVCSGIAVGTVAIRDDPLVAAGTVLFAATSLTTSYTVQRGSDSAVTYQIQFAKPNKIRIESSAQLIVADGSTITTIDKSDSSYERHKETDTELKSLFDKNEMALLGAFFDAGYNGRFSGAVSVGKKDRQGVSYDVMTATVGSEGFTFYIDPSDHLIKLAQAAPSDGSSSGRMLLLTKGFQTGASIADSAFAYTPPADAKNMSANAPLKLPRDQMPNISSSTAFSDEPDLGSCCPTATSDGLAFLSMNGFDALAPGGSTAQRAIALARELAHKYYKTDKTLGTPWDRMFPGLVSFLDDRGYAGSTLQLYYFDPNPNWPVEEAGKDMPDLETIARASTRDSFVMVAQGWFSNPDESGICSRVTWHWATVSNVDVENGMITLNDPYQTPSSDGKPLRLKYTRLPANTNIVFSGKSNYFNTKDEPGAGVPILEKYPNVANGQFAMVEGVLIVTVAK